MPARHGGKWKPTPLKSELHGDGAQLHDLFDSDWLPADIVGPYPFDPSLEIRVLADDTWQIQDAGGGVVVEREGRLVYKKGGMAISIAIKGMDEVTDFAQFSHELIQGVTQDAGEPPTCTRCSGEEPIVAGGMCSACMLAALAAHKAQQAAKKRTASSQPEGQAAQKKQKTSDEDAASGGDAKNSSDDDESDAEGSSEAEHPKWLWHCYV